MQLSAGSRRFLALPSRIALALGPAMFPLE
jgi:hypothetical protein